MTAHVTALQVSDFAKSGASCVTLCDTFVRKGSEPVLARILVFGGRGRRHRRPKTETTALATAGPTSGERRTIAEASSSVAAQAIA